MKIPNGTIEEAVVLVQAILAGTGITVRMEVQDAEEFVLFIAEIPPETKEAKNRKLLLPYKEQFQQLSGLIRPKEDGDYSWMVVFRVRNEVVDSVMAGAPLD